MKIADIRKIASQTGVKISFTMEKGDLIRAIQATENNEPCFGTYPQDCGQHGCTWRQDCLDDNILSNLMRSLEKASRNLN